MRKMLTCAILALTVMIAQTAFAQVDTVTILHLNDTHSHLLPYGPKDAAGDWSWGGWAKIATVIGMNRMTEPNVMLMHSGDIFVGDFMFQEYLGIAELNIMNALGFDVMELGNHEFDLYPSTLKYVLNEAGFPSTGFPILCANLDISGDPELGYFVEPYLIREYGGVKIGIIGLLNDLTNQISNPSPIIIQPPLDVAQTWVDSLKNKLDCDLVIVLSHMGIDLDQMAAASISGIDIIVGGHSHTEVPQPAQIGNTLIVQAGEFGKYVGKLQLITSEGQLTDWNYDYIAIDESIPAEPSLEAMINNLADGVEADPRFGPVYSNVVANASVELSKPLGEGFIKDNSLGNLIADAYRDATETDIAMQPQGFISQTIYKGDVTGSDIFQAVPYGFDEASGLGMKLATFETTGMSLFAGLEFAVYNLPYVEDFFQHVSNMSYAYDLSLAPGSRIDYVSVRINGLPVDPSGLYTVTVPDAVVAFLNQIPDFYVNNLVVTDDFVYTIVRDYIVSNSPVAYYPEGRVLDMTVASNPVPGFAALSLAIDDFSDNGDIDDESIAYKLKHRLNIVEDLFQKGNYDAVLAELMVFRLHVRNFARQGHILSTAEEILTTLSGKISEAIQIYIAGGKAGVVTNIPVTLESHRSYPNPFNQSTKIEFTLAQSSHVKLEIYNILGQRVETLVDENEEAGTHTLVWKADNVPSGLYFYRIVAGDNKDTRKIILLK